MKKTCECDYPIICYDEKEYCSVCGKDIKSSV